MTKPNYSPGMEIGPKNILFIKEAGHKIVGKTSPRPVRLGVFICPLCGKEFVNSLIQIASGHTQSCGCSHELDLTNKKFGKLTVLYKTPNKKDKINNNFWHCICDCGVETDVRATDLNNGKTQSCGCQLNLTGERFGHLTAIKIYSKGNKNGSRKWLCKCDCGQQTIVTTGHLRSGHTKSCGCINSRGEELVGTTLSEMSIQYAKQKTFKECVNPKTGRLLRFDFYLPDYNICVEYDGEQHYYYNDKGWNTKEKLKMTRYRDNIKNKFCKENDIKLIRIPYWDFDKIDKDYILELLN